MPRVAITVDCDMNDPADVVLADKLIEMMRMGYTHPLNPLADLAPTPAGVAEAQPSKARGRKKDDTPAEPVPAAKEFVVFRPDGQRRAGYSISKDAADVLIFDAEKLNSSADLSEFGKHNIPTIARLDKPDQERVQQAITAHVQKVKDAEKAAATPTPSAEDKLAAAFGPTLIVDNSSVEPMMSKDDFILAMIALSDQMGPTASRAWITGVGFATPLEVPEARYNEVVAAGKAHINMLKGE